MACDSRTRPNEGNGYRTAGEHLPRLRARRRPESQARQSRSPAPLDLKRVRLPINEEQPIAPIYGYAFVSDAVEGLVVIDIRTLSDGIPTNNSLIDPPRSTPMVN